MKNIKKFEQFDPELDPYSEEDWEFDNTRYDFINSNKPIKDFLLSLDLNDPNSSTLLTSLVDLLIEYYGGQVNSEPFQNLNVDHVIEDIIGSIEIEFPQVDENNIVAIKKELERHKSENFSNF